MRSRKRRAGKAVYGEGAEQRTEVRGRQAC